MELWLHASLSLYLIRVTPNMLSDRYRNMSAQSRSRGERRFAFHSTRVQPQ
jgi:hypothetical protein